MTRSDPVGYREVPAVQLPESVAIRPVRRSRVSPGIGGPRATPAARRCQNWLVCNNRRREVERLALRDFAWRRVCGRV